MFYDSKITIKSLYICCRDHINIDIDNEWRALTFMSERDLNLVDFVVTYELNQSRSPSIYLLKEQSRNH